jgi:hypothetical protein
MPAEGDVPEGRQGGLQYGKVRSVRILLRLLPDVVHKGRVEDRRRISEIVRLYRRGNGFDVPKLYHFITII